MEVSIFSFLFIYKMGNLKEIVFVLLLFLSIASFNSIKNIDAEKLNTPIEATGAPPNLIRRPYLQILGAESVTIIWKTDTFSEKSNVLFYKKNKKHYLIEKNDLTTQEASKFNEVELKSLTPSTTCFYEIYSNDHFLARGENYHFIIALDYKSTTFSFYGLGNIGAKVAWSFVKEPANLISELENTFDSFTIKKGRLRFS